MQQENHLQNMPLKYFGQFTFFFTFILCVSFNIQIGKIKTFLIDYQPELCFKYVLKILLHLSLNVLIKRFV